jgi:hypothetical protein
MHLAATPVLSSVRRVVVDGDNLLLPVLRAAQVTRVVLESELDALTELEVGRLAAELPDDLASATIDLVSGVCITSRDEVVAFVVLVDAVDVEVVPGVGGVVTAACLAGVQGEEGF